MDRHELQEVFTPFKPLCDSLMKDPSIKCSLEVIDCIKTISDGAIQDLLDYILFPVIVHLQNEDVSKHSKEYLIVGQTDQNLDNEVMDEENTEKQDEESNMNSMAEEEEEEGIIYQRI